MEGIPEYTNAVTCEQGFKIVRIKTFQTHCFISGPFIVMVSHMIGDVVVFALLYLEFYIPYGKCSHILLLCTIPDGLVTDL